LKGRADCQNDSGKKIGPFCFKKISETEKRKDLRINFLSTYFERKEKRKGSQKSGIHLRTFGLC